MKTFTVAFDADNAAFEPEPEHEIARILRVIAERVENGEDISHFKTIFDINGNDVGRYSLRSQGVEPARLKRGHA